MYISTDIKHFTVNYYLTFLPQLCTTVLLPDTKIRKYSTQANFSLFQQCREEGTNELLQALADPVHNRDYSAVIHRQLSCNGSWISNSLDRLLNNQCLTSTILRHTESLPTLVKTQDDHATCEYNLIEAQNEQNLSIGICCHQVRMICEEMISKIFTTKEHINMEKPDSNLSISTLS